MSWWKSLKGKVRLNEPLKDKTTFRIGGPAKFFIEPKDIADLRSLVNASARFRFSIFVIGAGSNILVDDAGINGSVVRLSSPYFKKIHIEGNHIQAGSGVTISRLISQALAHGLSGLEFLAGIPGTLGGALMMNAGAWGKRIADFVQEISVMDYSGKVMSLKRSDLVFGYRSSNLKKHIILSADLKLCRKSRERIKGNIEQYLTDRFDTQDNSRPNAGCIFKNPSPREPAGRIIDLCGLKGSKVGDAFISFKHANFILNYGHASSSEVIKLMNLIKRSVKKKFSINLELEIKIWP